MEQNIFNGPPLVKVLGGLGSGSGSNTFENIYLENVYERTLGEGVNFYSNLYLNGVSSGISNQRYLALDGENKLISVTGQTVIIPDPLYAKTIIQKDSDGITINQLGLLNNTQTVYLYNSTKNIQIDAGQTANESQIMLTASSVNLMSLYVNTETKPTGSAYIYADLNLPNIRSTTTSIKGLFLDDDKNIVFKDLTTLKDIKVDSIAEGTTGAGIWVKHTMRVTAAEKTDATRFMCLNSLNEIVYRTVAPGVTDPLEVTTVRNPDEYGAGLMMERKLQLYNDHQNDSFDFVGSTNFLFVSNKDLIGGLSWIKMAIGSTLCLSIELLSGVTTTNLFGRIYAPNLQTLDTYAYDLTLNNVGFIRKIYRDYANLTITSLTEKDTGVGISLNSKLLVGNKIVFNTITQETVTKFLALNTNNEVVYNELSTLPIDQLNVLRIVEKNLDAGVTINNMKFTTDSTMSTTSTLNILSSILAGRGTINFKTGSVLFGSMNYDSLSPPTSLFSLYFPIVAPHVWSGGIVYSDSFLPKTTGEPINLNGCSIQNIVFDQVTFTYNKTNIVHYLDTGIFFKTRVGQSGDYLTGFQLTQDAVNSFDYVKLILRYMPHNDSITTYLVLDYEGRVHTKNGAFIEKNFKEINEKLDKLEEYKKINENLKDQIKLLEKKIEKITENFETVNKYICLLSENSIEEKIKKIYEDYMLSQFGQNKKRKI
jgi:hypothetical protein